MTRRRFYAPSESFADDGASVTLAHEEARHLRDVLRLKRGDKVHVFDGTGNEYLCAVEDAGRANAGATLAVVERAEPQSPESPLKLTLAVALLKGEKFDLVVQKATELGAVSILPVLTKRADVRVRDMEDATRRLLRWQRLALEAAKQSGRAVVPTIKAHASFGALVADAWDRVRERRLMFVERGGRGLAQASNKETARTSSITALVGPEGGWEAEEIAQAEAAGWEAITLGGRTLRAETAGIVVAALLQHLFGDLK